MTPNEFSKSVMKAAVPGSIEEDPGLLTFETILDNNDRRHTWVSLRSAPPGFVTSRSIRDSEGDSDLEDTENPTTGKKFLVAVRTIATPSMLHLFFSAQLVKFVDRLPSFNVVCLADLVPESETFATYNTRYQLWADEAVAPFPSREQLPDPRRFSIDFSGSNAVPADIRPWLLQSPPGSDAGAAYRIWRLAASCRLMAAIADQISVSGNGYIYHFSGPPSYKFEDTGAVVDGLHDRLDAGAKWVFVDGARDTETRHVLLAAEWARSFGNSGPAGLGTGSLESARAAYGAYVKSGSKETLKALADLRKTVVEDAQKTTQKAQDMTGALWKDLAVSTIPFVVKVLPDAAKTANSVIACLFAIGALAYLIFSFRTQTYLNSRFLEAQDQFRTIWKRRLNQLLSAQEVEDFADGPITRSVQDYERIRKNVAWVYRVLVICLGVFAAYQGYGAYMSIKSPPQYRSNHQQGSPSNGQQQTPAPPAQGAGQQKPGGP